MMKTKIILGLIMALAIMGTVVSAQGVSKDLVVNNLLVGNHLRSDGSLEINGELFVDDVEGWTGTCNGDNLQVRDGIVIGCGYE